MRKALQVATVASMHDLFNRDNIKTLQDLGYKVDILANFDEGSATSIEKVDSFKKEMNESNVDTIQVSFPRSIFKVGKIINSYKLLKNLAIKHEYEIVHCHSPIASALTRFAFRKERKNGTKIIYTAHGFHFFKGAPLINWLIYYPIEKICSRYTDLLITINKEDYQCAQKNMKAKEIKYIQGVGIDITKYNTVKCSKKKIRSELSIPNNAKVILSVGELNDNKNHIIIIKALAKLQHDNIHYCIAGRGNLMYKLINEAKMLGISDRLHILGYRTDIAELNCMADIFAFPSKREGLGLAAIEAMATGLPLICSDNRGSRDYARHNDNALVCNSESAEQFAEAISILIKNEELSKKMGYKNKQIAQRYDKKVINCIMNDIYLDINK